MKRALLVFLLVVSLPAMAQRTINSLPAGTPAQATDEVAIQRGTTPGSFSYKLTVGDIRAAIALSAITGLGTGVATALAVNTGSAGAFVVFNGAGGTPSSMTGTNITGTAAGLTAGTASAVAVGGITGLGTGVGTWLATPSSANLASAVTGETGSGALMFGTSPTASDLTVTGSINIPNGTGPTTDAAGEIAFDTNAWTRGAMQVYDGTANTYVVAALASDTPSNGQVPVWNTGGTITWEANGGGGGTGCIPAGNSGEVLVDDGAGGCTATGVTISGDEITASNLLEAGALTDGLPCVYESTGTFINCNAALTVAQGGTGLTSGTSGGIPYFSASGTIASSAALASGAVVLGGGAGTTPATTTTAAGFVTWLGTPSSANFFSLITGESGSGAVLGGTGPTMSDAVVTGSLNIPNGTAPTTDAAGEIAFDTNIWGASRGTVQIFDGTANTYAVNVLASDTPTNGQVPVWNTGGTITWESNGGGSGCTTSGSNGQILTDNGSGGCTSNTTGTGVVTAAGVNTNASGGFHTIGGALGTPASGDTVNLTINVGNSDTTLTRAGAGVIAVEGVNVTRTIFAGTATVNPGAVTSGTCSSAITVSATGVVTTDVIEATPNADPTSTTGYNPAGDLVFLWVYPTADNINLKLCNKSGSSVTPGSRTFNIAVRR